MLVNIDQGIYLRITSEAIHISPRKSRHFSLLSLLNLQKMLISPTTQGEVPPLPPLSPSLPFCQLLSPRITLFYAFKRIILALHIRLSIIRLNPITIV